MFQSFRQFKSLRAPPLISPATGEIRGIFEFVGCGCGAAPAGLNTISGLPRMVLAAALGCAILGSVRKKKFKKRELDDAAAREPLQELRDALLELHKTLIDSERAVYETNVGPIHSPHHFLQLLSSDSWFAWLRPISQLIVAMDEALDGDEPLTSDSVEPLINQSVFLLIPAEYQSEFGQRYTAALQRDPDVVLAHAKVAKRIGSGKPHA